MHLKFVVGWQWRVPRRWWRNVNVTKNWHNQQQHGKDHQQHKNQQQQQIKKQMLTGISTKDRFQFIRNFFTTERLKRENYWYKNTLVPFQIWRNKFKCLIVVILWMYKIKSVEISNVLFIQRSAIPVLKVFNTKIENMIYELKWK